MKRFDIVVSNIKQTKKINATCLKSTVNISINPINSINTTVGTSGRFCNHFIRNMAAHFISKKNNIKFRYSYYNDFKKLGIDLFVGNNTYNRNINLTDKNLINYIEEKDTRYNIKCIDYFQIPEFSKILRDYITNSENKEKIMKNNKNNERYNNNNDLYVHVRLGDVKRFNPGFEYYDNAISKSNFSKGYISSDSINDPICRKLIQKYNLIVFNGNEIETILFASTCKHLVLSNGTFSWTIGVFGFFSNVYYPICKIKWNGNIFIFNDWNGIHI
jgi:hypothetical protein